METEERIRIIDLAWEWARTKPIPTNVNWEVLFKTITERFDQAYKAILKTVTS